MTEDGSSKEIVQDEDLEKMVAIGIIRSYERATVREPDNYRTAYEEFEYITLIFPNDAKLYVNSSGGSNWSGLTIDFIQEPQK